MNLKLIDSHCHVHFEAYKDDMDEVVERALDAGIGMIAIGTQSTTSKNAIELANRYEGVWATIGLHPNHLHKQEFFDDNELPESEKQAGKIKTRSELFDADYYRTLVDDPNVVGIGEFGLDYYRIPEHETREQVVADQKEAVAEQLRFASEVEKPVIIHCRDAHEDQFDLLNAEINNGGLKKRGVIHCFTGLAADAARYNELGFYVSIPGIVTFSKELQVAVKKIPLEQMLVETDSPYLTPVPFRGKRNEPLHVQHVAQMVADLKGVSVEEVAEITKQNTINLFNLG